MVKIYGYIGEVCRFQGNLNEAMNFHQKSLDLSLKTHFAKADYLALGLGYSLASRQIDKDNGNRTVE